jgi:hypothetical protein
MDSSSHSTEDNIERDSARLSSNEKFERFVQKNKTALLVAGIVAGVLLFGSLLYFLFFYESKMERFANDFCACAETSSSDFYNYTKDGFGYKSDMVECFGMEFSAYGQGYDKSTKRLLLDDFKEAVVEKCPEKLDNVFKYE